MTFKEIRQILLVQIDFLANSPNFSHTKLLLFMVTVKSFDVRLHWKRICKYYAYDQLAI